MMMLQFGGGKYPFIVRLGDPSSKPVNISHKINILGKAMNPIILLPFMDK